MATTEEPMVDWKSFKGIVVGTDTYGTALLHIQAADNSDVAIFSGTTGTSTRGLRISLANEGAGNQVVILDSQQASGILTFETAGTERMRIHTGGDICVGGTDPVSLFEIRGGLTTEGSVLSLGTKETTVVANDVLGRINFYAPLEASETDAILPGASIAAIAEAEFTASVNSTSLVFQTGESDTATTKMTIDSAGVIKMGDGTNQTVVSAAGVITWEGTAKRILTIRPEMNLAKIAQNEKPTMVTYGAHQCFSMPIYDTDDEELFFVFNMPGRWDGSSDLTMHVICALGSAETANDDFNLQLSWQSTTAGSDPSTSVILENTTVDVEVETNIADARKAQYNVFEIEFTLDWDNAGLNTNLGSHDTVVCRLRRIAAAGTEIDGQILILDSHVHMTIDKVAKAP